MATLDTSSAAFSAAPSALARRYADALFALADEHRQLDDVARDLEGLGAALGESEDLRRLVTSPVVGRKEQQAAMDAVGEKLGLGTTVRNLVGVLAANRRLAELQGVIAAYLGELAHRRGEIGITVTSAVPLSDEQAARLKETLDRVLAAKVNVTAKVDPSILGGLVVRAGSRLLDSSIATKLARLEAQMSAA